MATSLVDIPTACSSLGWVTVVGVVVDALDVFRTRGSSSCVTFTIKDSEFDAPTWQGGLKVKYFNDNENFLPQVRLNDVVLLRKIRVRVLVTISGPELIDHAPGRFGYTRANRLGWLLSMIPFPGPSFAPRQTQAPASRSTADPNRSNRLRRKREQL